jgi:hypothetical protein
MGAVAAQPAPAPTIQWSPSVVTHTIGSGSASDLLEATFTSSESLADVTVFITPNLRPFIQLESLEFAQISAGAMYEISGLFVVPPGAAAGVYDGTIHLRLGNRTVARPLPVTLTVDYGDIQVPDTTAVVSDTAAAQIKDIIESEDGSTIVFEETAAEIRELVAGDVLVLGVTPQTPNGMLRKVEQVIDTGTELKVVTSATLEDTVEMLRCRSNVH